MSGVAVYTKIEDGKYFHRMVALRAGEIVPTHRHRYDHVTTCRAGRATLWAESGGEKALGPGESWTVAGGIAHDIEFLEAGTIVECEHVLRRADGSPVPFDYELSPRERVELTGLL